MTMILCNFYEHKSEFTDEKSLMIPYLKTRYQLCIYVQVLVCGECNATKRGPRFLQLGC